MIGWNLFFDFATIFFIAMILIWNFNEKAVPLRSHRAFLTFLTLIALCATCEIFATKLAERAVDETFYVALSLHNFFINLVPVALTYYLLQICHVSLKKHKGIYCFLLVHILIDVVVNALNPWLKWAFVFEGGRFLSRYANLVLYVLAMIVLLVGVIHVVRQKRNLMFVKLVPLLFNVICGVLAIYAQLVLYIPMLNFALVSLAFTLFYYQQNPRSVIDIVTGLFNRQFMGEFIKSKYTDQEPFGVVLVAIDDFKFINKTYGIDAGDQLLYQIGYYLEHLPYKQTVFRFGSDQFCFVLHKGYEDILDIATDVQNRFLHPWYTDAQASVMMSATICTMNCPEDAADLGELIEVMDYAMSMAKKTNKGHVTASSETELDKIKKDKAIEKAVQLAVDRNELMVHYQPIFSVEKGCYNSAEALVRLNDAELGWISPEKFIPIAEKNGLIVAMGEVILEKVCMFIRDFKLSDTSVEYVEVNISPVQLIQTDFADRVKMILERYDVKPEQINMEITETANVSSTSVLFANIQKLVDYGVTFSLDDYGSGHANIDYINRMPFKIIKIDKTIIWDAFKSTKAGVTLEYTIGMLNALDLSIVAEGVETEEMKSCLENYGCHYMQGWYYSKAVADTEFMKLLEAQG